MAKKSRILVVGATGELGQELVKASLSAGHPTFALVREQTFSHPLKSLLLHSFADAGVTLLKGSLDDFPSLLEAVKQADAVICAVPSNQALEQKLLVRAIKEAGFIKRFIPSEFGADPDKVQILGMDYDFYEKKAEIRRLIETEGIPYTYISCNFFMRYLLPSLVQPGQKTPPRDRIKIFGDGNTRAIFVKESDVAAFTISTIDDPQTLNKVLYLRPPGNVVSLNELAEIWEMKIGKNLQKVYISEEQLLKSIQETPFPSNMELIFIYSAFIKGDHTYFSINSSGLEGTQLYSHVKHTTVMFTLYHRRHRLLMASEQSKILIIGGTGYIGKFIVQESARSGHPTFAMVRESTAASNPTKAKIIEGFKNSGVTLVHGDLYDHASLVKAIKQVDVVISTVGRAQLPDQTKIIAAIKEAGNVKRFFPSEFGTDGDRVHAVEPAKSAFATKAKIRRAVEAEGIPYTYVSSNFFAGYFLPTLGQAGAKGLPTDKVVILGDGNTKAIFVCEEDIGTFTIKAVDDPRTLNKILYVRPPGNIYSHNELVSLWEKKTGKTFQRVYVPEEEVLKQIREAPIPLNVVLSICHSVFIKGDHTNFEIKPSFGIEATQLYPDVKYASVDEYLNRFL